MTTPPREDIDAAARELRHVLAFNLRMARLAVRMTQRELSIASGISQKHISQIEMVGANIGIDVLAALAHALPGVNAADLLTPSPRRHT
nr:helix-turn-helix transcriptional regulator [uncultured Rhodopila sp.]